MKTFIAWIRFTWHLWRHVRYDGTGHKIGLWYAATWAADRKFWEPF